MSETNSLLSSNFNKTKLDKIQVLLVDDHPLMRFALRTWIERQRDFDVIAEAGDGKEAVEIVNRLGPDVVVMDLSMPKLNGLEATKQIKDRFPNIKILMLSVYNDREHMKSALNAGANGYLAKDISGEEIVHAIRAVVNGEIITSHPKPSQDIFENTFNSNSHHNIDILPVNKVDRLNSREITLLKIAAKGKSNKEIAFTLNLKERTVKSHFSTIFLKLCVSSRSEAVATSLKLGVINLEDFN